MTKTNQSRGKKIFNAVLTVIIILLAVLIAVTLYSRATGKQVLSYSFLWVLSPSMEETIPMHSYILVKAVDPAKIGEGDVITFHSRDPELQGALNTHRVVRIEDNGEFRTKGDHNIAEDAYTVKPSDVVAIYVCNLPILTFFGRIFASPAGVLAMLSFVMVLTAMFFRIYVRKIEKTDKKEELDRRIEEEIAKIAAEELKKQAEAQADAEVSEKQAEANAEAEEPKQP